MSDEETVEVREDGGIRIGDKFYKYIGSPNERAKTKLKNQIEEQVIKVAGRGILDMAQVAIGNPESYKVFRSKALRIFNNSVRQLEKKIDEEYAVIFEQTGKESVVSFEGKGEGKNER